MYTKKKLLTIGEISKFSGSSVKSLRYYERIGILKPIYINPESGYRYFSFDQIYLIEVIQFCVELDIPLKELMRFIDTNENLDYAALLAYGKEIAQKKLAILQNGLKFIHSAEKEIELVEQYHESSTPYSRDLPEMYLLALPLPLPFNEEEFTSILSQLFSVLESHETNPFDFMDYGLLYEYSPSNVSSFVFVEVPKHLQHLENVKLIPAGCYRCQQSEESRIEDAPKIFPRLFKGESSLIVIETELFASNYQISNPIKELRVLPL